MFIRIAPEGINADGFICFEGKINLFFRGYVIWNNHLYMDKEFIPVLLGHYNSGSISNHIKEYNGNFEFVIYKDKKVIIGNDRYGIYPLFYFQSDEELILTTQWEKLISNSGKIFQDDSILEYLVFGNVLGKKTLIKNLFELDPATLLKVSVRAGRLEYDSTCYWELTHKFKPGRLHELEKDFAKLWETQLKIYSDFVKNHGNCCVQLLSGGLDSRLLANEFDQAGVAINAITYGGHENDDEIISALRVSELLAHCTSHKTIILDTKEMQRINRSNITYDKITQARNADKDLYSYHKLSDRCQFRIPGYSGDFTAGSHIKYRMKFWHSKENILDYILKFKLNPMLKTDLKTNLNHREQLINSLNQSIETNKDPVSAYIQWDLKNRQRRFVVRAEIENNSGPTNLLLPFFDYKILDFFLELPMEALMNTRLYINSQIKYLYKNNPELLKIKRDNKKRQKIIYSNFYYEYSSKVEHVVKEFRNRRNNKVTSCWSGDIDWQAFYDSWDLPEIKEEFKIQTQGINGESLLFLLTLLKLKTELSEL